PRSFAETRANLPYHLDAIGIRHPHVAQHHIDFGVPMQRIDQLLRPLESQAVPVRLNENSAEDAQRPGIVVQNQQAWLARRGRLLFREPWIALPLNAHCAHWLDRLCTCATCPDPDVRYRTIPDSSRRPGIECIYFRP